jgi:hypothetical protein
MCGLYKLQEKQKNWKDPDGYKSEPDIKINEPPVHIIS